MNKTRHGFHYCQDCLFAVGRCSAVVILGGIKALWQEQRRLIGAISMIVTDGPAN